MFVRASAVHFKENFRNLGGSSLGNFTWDRAALRVRVPGGMTDFQEWKRTGTRSGQTFSIYRTGIQSQQVKKEQIEGHLG